MYPTAITKIRWLQMTKIKDCSQIINGNKCPCADNLRRLYLKKPKLHESDRRIQQQIEISLKKYEDCFTH